MILQLNIPENLHKITQQCGCLFYKQKSPLYRSHGIYTPLSLYAGSGGTPYGLCPILCPTICVLFRVKFDLFWVYLIKKKPLNKEGLYVSQKWFLTSRGERIRTSDLLPKQGTDRLFLNEGLLF